MGLGEKKLWKKKIMIISFQLRKKKLAIPFVHEFGHEFYLSQLGDSKEMHIVMEIRNNKNYLFFVVIGFFPFFSFLFFFLRKRVLTK